MVKKKTYKFLKKFLIAFVLTVAVFSFLQRGPGNVVFVVDDANDCTWEDLVVTEATHLPPESRLFEVKADLEDNYVADSAENKVCTAKRNDNSTEYAAFLNEAYDLYVVGEADPNENKLESTSGGFVVE